jgi:ribulose-phosphate 3-epimerase
MFVISPSVLSGNLFNLEQQLVRLKGLRNLHLDIDDGNFVRGISFGLDVVRAIAEHTDIPLDAHLEVLNPLDYVDELCDCGVERLCAHVEALPYPSLFLSRVRQKGAKAGLALNLKTPVAVLETYADQLDYIILVSVEADCDGLPLRPGVLGKIRAARKLLSPAVNIWVDGGVNETNLRPVVENGADGVVIGRAVFNASQPVKEYERLLGLAEKIRTDRESEG